MSYLINNIIKNNNRNGDSLIKELEFIMNNKSSYSEKDVNIAEDLCYDINMCLMNNDYFYIVKSINNEYNVKEEIDKELYQFYIENNFQVNTFFIDN